MTDEVDDGFRTIETYSDWCFYDQIDGKSVTDGIYTVKWPDGTQTDEFIKAESDALFISGRDGSVPELKAIMHTRKYGFPIEIRAIGLSVKKISEK